MNAPAGGERDRDPSVDAFLGGRLTVAQPRRGHRSGLEAVLIAAAAPLRAGETVADLGAGVGVAGLCALARVPDTRALLIEADEGLAGFARANAERNGLGDRVAVHVVDITVRGAGRRLADRADHAIANPPFNDAATSRSSPAKARAHTAGAGMLESWLRFAATVVRPGGTLTLVHRAEALGAVLSACAGRFGGIAVLPLHPRPDLPAHRIILHGRKGSRAALSLMPGLVLHGPDGHAFLPGVEAVLREGAPLRIGREGGPRSP